jgi:hypothetical protein
MGVGMQNPDAGEAPPGHVAVVGADNVALYHVSSIRL